MRKKGLNIVEGERESEDGKSRIGRVYDCGSESVRISFAGIDTVVGGREADDVSVIS